MQKTVETSELFKHRINLVEKKVKLMEQAILDRDFDTFAKLTMKDSNEFHAVCLDTFPPIFYLVNILTYIERNVTFNH
jgi:diphosphomevalonate decarboxylase